MDKHLNKNNDIYSFFYRFPSFCVFCQELEIKHIKELNYKVFNSYSRMYPNNNDIELIKKEFSRFKDKSNSNDINLSRIQYKQVDKDNREDIDINGKEKINALQNVFYYLDNVDIKDKKFLQKINYYAQNLSSKNSNLSYIRIDNNIDNAILNLVDKEQEIIKTYNLLGREYVLSLLRDTIGTINNTILFIHALKNCENRYRLIEEIKGQIDKIHMENRYLNLSYINPLFKDISEKYSIKYVHRLKNFDLNRLNDEELEIINKNLHVLSIDLSNQLKEKMYDAINYRKPNKIVSELLKKIFHVVMLRVRGSSLEAIGDKYGCTRERVRQIIVKVFNNLEKLFDEINIIEYLKIFSNNPNYILYKELRKYLDEYAIIIFYYFKDKGIYDTHNKLLVLSDTNWLDRVYGYIRNDLPDVLDYNELNEYTKDLCDEFREKDINIDYLIIRNLIISNFIINGKVITRYKLSLAQKYTLIIKNFFPGGIRVYDKDEVRLFRECYNSFFDDNQIAENDRAIYGRIVDSCILIDRGKYRLRQENYISKDLLNSIYEFIHNNSNNIIPINVIYQEFEEELVKEGVGNRYFLQGILRQSYKSKFSFRRDYLLKEDIDCSLYKEVNEYIKSLKGLATHGQIIDRFPYLNNIYFKPNLDEDIIILSNTYIHKDYFVVNEDERQSMLDIIDRELYNKDIVHINNLYNQIYSNVKAFAQRFFIDDNLKLFNALDYLYSDYYNFKRPFISRQNVHISNKKDLLCRYIYEYEELSLSDIKEFAKEYVIIIPSIIDLVASLKGYIFKNKQEIIRLDRIKMDSLIISEIENCLTKMISSTKAFLLPIDIDYSVLPDILIEWNEWVLYSIIKELGIKFSTFLTNTDLRQSIPIFIDKRMQISDFEAFGAYLKREQGWDDQSVALYLNSFSI